MLKKNQRNLGYGVVLLFAFFGVTLVHAQTAPTLGACIPSSSNGIAKDNIEQTDCPPPDQWTANNTSISGGGLCITPDQSVSEANVTADTCTGTFIPNTLPATATTASPAPSSADAQSNPATNITEPEVRIPIPGLQFTSPSELLTQALANGSNQALYIPYIAEYIRAVYQYAIILAAVLSMIMIIVAGFEWASSGGNSDAIGAAKTRIGQAITGLIIALGSYTLLVTINPALVNFVPLKINSISTVNLDEVSAELFTDSSGGSGTDTPAQSYSGIPDGLVPIPEMLNVEHPHVNNALYKGRPQFVSKLQEALTDFLKKYPDYVVVVNSVVRTAQEQYNIMRKEYGCPAENTLPKDNMTESEIAALCPRIAANGRAGASVGRKDGKLSVRGLSHFGGNAIDMGVAEAKGKNSAAGVPCAGQISEVKKSMGVWNAKGYYGANDCVTVAQQQLIGVMLKHGFCVGIKQLDGTKTREAWHFELPDNGMAVYGFCAKSGEPFADKDHLPLAF